MDGIGHALMPMHCYSDFKIMNDVEEYVKLLGWREKEGEMLLQVAQSGRVIKVALCM